MTYTVHRAAFSVTHRPHFRPQTLRQLNKPILLGIGHRALALSVSASHPYFKPPLEVQRQWRGVLSVRILTSCDQMTHNDDDDRCIGRSDKDLPAEPLRVSTLSLLPPLPLPLAPPDIASLAYCTCEPVPSNRLLCPLRLPRPRLERSKKQCGTHRILELDKDIPLVMVNMEPRPAHPLPLTPACIGIDAREGLVILVAQLRYQHLE